MAYCIGVIGGIATGKTAVTNILAGLGAEIIDTDQISRELLMPGLFAYQEIVAHFGQEVLATDATINRARLRRIIFEDETQRHWLEHLLHPLIRESVELKAKKSQARLCVVAIPLLKNREDYPYLDVVWLVMADEATRIARLTQRDGVDWTLACKMIANQPSIEQQKTIADSMIENNQDLSHLKQTLLEKLKALENG